jgi:hypothetical protein
VKKLLAVPLVAGLVLVLSGCFVMQGFTLKNYALSPGGKTKAVFTLRPASTSANTNKEFVIVGVEAGGPTTIGKATWGVNGTYGGPKAMVLEPSFVAAMGTECASNGFQFADVTNVTWKAFLTPTKVNDRGTVGTKSVVEVGINVKAAASSDDSTSVIGVSGSYSDNGDGTINGADTFLCTGVSQVALYVK